MDCEESGRDYYKTIVRRIPKNPWLQAKMSRKILKKSYKNVSESLKDGEESDMSERHKASERQKESQPRIPRGTGTCRRIKELEELWELFFFHLLLLSHRLRRLFFFNLFPKKSCPKPFPDFNIS